MANGLLRRVTMKKTLRKKLHLAATTLRTLQTQELHDAQGALVDTHTCRFCPGGPTVVSCSCRDSVCNSCYNTDCCLEIP